MWQLSIVLGWLLMIGHTVRSDDHPCSDDVCSLQGCRRDKKNVTWCQGQEKCFIKDFDIICQSFKDMEKPCHVLSSNREFLTQKCAELQPDTGTSKAATIVIAVCVSVVVLAIAVLIAGVYCWRVRRRRSTDGGKAIDTDQRNNSVMNRAYRSDSHKLSSRPDSTYNTINDLQPDHVYTVLKAEPNQQFGDHVTAENRTPAKGTGDYEGSNTYGDGEYNRIRFNKSPEVWSDPSYSHLGSNSDYSSGVDSASKTGAYNYGVPIRIKDVDDTRGGRVKLNKGERETTSEANGADDDYVIPKDEQDVKKSTTADKPKAIVNPMNISTDNSGTYSYGRVSNISGDKGSDYEAGADQIKKTPVAADDYEKAVVANAHIEDTPNDGHPKIELPFVKVKADFTETDDYEEAVISNTDAKGTGGEDDGIVELPRVQVKTDCPESGGYEEAVIKT